VVEATARARFVRISPRKARQVMDLIRNKPAQQALNLLQNSPRKAARIISKTLRSAVANAVQTEGSGRMTAEDLHVKRALVDDGATLKRWMPRAMGRATVVRHRTSHFTVVVEGDLGEEAAAAPASKRRAAKKRAAPARPAKNRSKIGGRRRGAED
jgi:large subunit ribosomal protein L22